MLLVVDHDCDTPDLVDIGTTSYGTRVLINPLSIGRKVICIGGTVHHLMAGYGGGRKSIVPGIAGRETIRHNHAMALDPQCEQSDPRVGPGKFNNNPINEDMREAGALLHPVFGINIVVNSASRHSGLFCGDSMLHGGKAASMSSNVTVFRSKIRQMLSLSAAAASQRT